MDASEVSRFRDCVVPSSGRFWSASICRRFQSGEHICTAEKLFRQAQQSLCALAILSIHEHQGAVVRFSNLTAQWQPNAGAVWLRGKERNEEIGGVHNAGTFVFNKDLKAISFLTPPKCDISMGFKRGINCVVQQID